MKVAVLGLGSAGSRHARNLVALGHEVTGFDPGTREGPAAIERADSLAEAIRWAEAVIVASPSSMHAEQALAALAEGRHVLVEKPLASNVRDAATVGEAAAGAGLIAGVAMNLRFHPGLVALKTLLDKGDLGTPHLAEAVFGYDLRRWRPGTDYRRAYSARAELGGGIVLDAIHELDYLLWLLGPVSSVVAESGRVSSLDIDVEDVALGIMTFASGALATASLNFFEPAYRRGCTLVGADAVARWVWEQDVVAVTRADDSVTEIHASGDVSDTYVSVVDDFIAAIAQGRPTRTTIGEGLDAVRLAVALKQSARDGRRVTLGSAS